MVRLAKFTETQFIESAIDLAAQCGVKAVSMSAIAGKTGAPIGSIYHRFDSRGTILAHAWLRVKTDFRQEVASRWQCGDSWNAVVGLLDWCRRKPVYARFLMLDDDAWIVDASLSLEMLAALETEQAELDACFEHCALALQGKVDAEAVAPMLRFILIDGPVAIVKPYLTNNQPIPACVDVILRASHDAVRGWANRTN
ncbi:MAG: TetR/AcrR family transcriptional regulator [Sulfuriferula sp.]|nr:TetR/AcrR family transcriptional regulator [Sulfuriferula sp.]